MNEQEILEGNKLIAEFMGWVCQTDPTERWFGCWFDNRLRKSDSKNPLLFHISWDWLMPVLIKIGSLEIDDGDVYWNLQKDDFSLVVGKCSGGMSVECYYYSYLFESDYTNIINNGSIKSVWAMVIQFIKWYNKQ